MAKAQPAANDSPELAKVAAVIATLDETNGAPESMLYIFFDMNMDVWSRVRTILIDAKLIEVRANYVTLTDSGRKTAQKLNGVARS